MNLAVYLAIAGNGVVAATHAYDNFQDESGSGTASVIRGRAETISEAIDRILAPNPLNIIVDVEKIAVVGFSAGDASALALGGPRPSIAEAVRHCVTYDDPFRCFIDPNEQLFGDTTLMSGLSENRIRSIILLAPVTAYFTYGKRRAVKRHYRIRSDILRRTGCGPFFNPPGLPQIHAD